MKIALYLSGQVRNLHENQIWNPISTLFKGHEVDYYFHFWKEHEYTEEFILDRIKPKNYVFEPQVSFTPQSKYIYKHLSGKKLSSPRLYFNMMSFYYSFAQAKTIVPLDEYDLICKTRTDAYFFGGNLNRVLNAATKFILITNTKVNPQQRLTDMCFLGNPKLFSKVLDVAELATEPQKYIDDYQKRRNIRFTSHTYLSYAFEKHNIRYKQVPMNLTLAKHRDKIS